mmetsp:Transcript_16400/g.35458  ORF Transcript_16400/g.35458 Transcript_16400/m.35458 type:complete len:271 (+) Transcript_16400:1304-2116(+)
MHQITKYPSIVNSHKHAAARQPSCWCCGLLSPQCAIRQGVSGGHEQHTCQRVAQCHRQQVIQQELAHSHLGPQRHAHGDEAHVGDRVLTACNDEGCNWHPCANGLARQSGCCGRHPHSTAHQPVTQNAPEEGLGPGQAGLCHRHVGRHLVPGQKARRHHQPHHQQAADEVANIGPEPVLGQSPPSRFLLIHRGGDERRVASEEFRATHQRDHETKGEDEAHEQLYKRGGKDTCEGSAHCHGHKACNANIHASLDALEENLPCGHGCLCSS